MKIIIIRRSNKFCIDKTQLSAAANKDDICTALYVAVYDEFMGASEHPNYKDLSNLERLNKLNEFALNWPEKK
jgi:hypothetical protein